VETKDLIHLYTYATCYIQPSIVEGFGLPVLEAMTCGCLVLASSGGSLPEIARDAALYFNPSNKEELREKLEFIWISSSKEFAKYQELGIKQAAKFSWRKTASQTWDVYNTCLCA